MSFFLCDGDILYFVLHKLKGYDAQKCKMRNLIVQKAQRKEIAIITSWENISRDIESKSGK